MPVSAPETGSVAEWLWLKFLENRALFYDLPGGSVLIRAEKGLFRLDPGATAMVPVAGPETGSVAEFHDLPGGGVLIGAEKKGWFLAPRPGGHGDGARCLAGDRLRIRLPRFARRQRADQSREGLVPPRPGGPWRWCPLPCGRPAPYTASTICPAERADQIAEKGLFRLNPGAHGDGARRPAGDRLRIRFHDLPSGSLLIRAEKGLFRLNPGATAMVPVARPETGSL